MTKKKKESTPYGETRFRSLEREKELYNIINIQSEHIGQWATPHHLSDVRRGAPIA